jgi:small ligand-binding sensory domain FIST
MKWCSAVSEKTSLGEAVDECALKLRGGLDDARPDLVVGFVSAEHGPGYDGVPALVREALGGRVFIGCSGGGVIGEGREVEHRAGLSLTAAVLPGVRLTPFHVEDGDMPDGDAPPDSWEEMVGTAASAGPHFLLMADPFSVRGEHLVMGLDYAFPSSVKIGGLASSGQRPGENALFLGGEVYSSGAIGLAMSGNIAVDTVVAQGCRPVGEVMSITKCHQNILQEINERPPLEVLREVFAASGDRDRELMQHSLFLGIVMDDFIDEPRQGDFLIRNIVGLDGRTGSMAIGEMLREGQRVQLHLRDALTSADDLGALLARYSSERGVDNCLGALLFSCQGRGQYLYGRADHDTDMFHDKVGSIPLGGFFCGGEIGPVGGTTFLHGYTSSFGIFRATSGT